jgi:hypothetical protein
MKNHYIFLLLVWLMPLPLLGQIELGLLRPTGDIITQLERQVQEIEQTEQYVITKIKTDFIASGAPLSSSTEVVMSPGVGYRLCAMVPAGQAQKVSIKIYATDEQNPWMGLEARSWREIGGQTSAGNKCVWDFQLPSSIKKTAFFKIEVTAALPDKVGLVRYGLIMSEYNPDCWEGLNAAEKLKECSVAKFMKKGADAMKLLEENKIEVVGLETGVITSSVKFCIVPRKFYNHSLYSFLAFSNENVSDFLLGLGFPGNKLSLIEQVDNETSGKPDNQGEGDSEAIRNFYFEQEQEHKIIISAKQFSKTATDGQYLLIIARTERPMAAYPKGDEDKRLADLMKRKYRFNQSQLHQYRDDKWQTSGSPTNLSGHFTFCNNLTRIGYKPNQSSAEKVYTVYSRWMDEQGNFHFVAREEGKEVGKGNKFYVSKDGKTLGYLDFEMATTYVALQVSFQETLAVEACGGTLSNDNKNDMPPPVKARSFTTNQVSRGYIDSNEKPIVSSKEERIITFRFSEQMNYLVRETNQSSITYEVKSTKLNQETEQLVMEIRDENGRSYYGSLSTKENTIMLFYKQNGTVYFEMYNISSTR